MFARERRANKNCRFEIVPGVANMNGIRNNRLLLWTPTKSGKKKNEKKITRRRRLFGRRYEGVARNIKTVLISRKLFFRSCVNVKTPAVSLYILSLLILLLLFVIPVKLSVAYRYKKQLCGESLAVYQQILLRARIYVYVYVR